MSFTPFILKGQPIAHIFAKNANAIPCSSRTIYNYIDNNILTAKNIDLPRKVTYKPRKSKKKRDVNHTWKEGRKYTDFVAFIESNPEIPIVEMDTVEGLKGGKVILTMLFRNSSCMLGFLLPDKTQASVVEVFDFLEEKLGSILFNKTFPIILTDNGSEFNNPLLLEVGKEDFLRTNIYYCDPYSSYQKGRLEKNHEFIRYIVPKGKSFDGFIQADITMMINHINSTARDSLNGRTPFELSS
ncbi:MAG TPA: IS30 family transposase, partial [Clostridia bacterium]|nr:IS30 family transposase [Clostridia bacterium]